MVSLNSFRYFARDIKLSHTLFALPFAASAFFFGDYSFPGFQTVLLIATAMFCARSYAMGMNRVIDSDIDAGNPRTESRAIPSGKLQRFDGLFWTMFFAAAFVLSSFLIGDLVGKCSVGLLFLLGFYPYWKKISWLTHWYLGLCLGLAPIAVSVALTSRVSWDVIGLGVAVAMWTAGFDILYALQDIKFDKEQGLQSVPAVFGPSVALWFSRLCFLTTVSILAYIGFTAEKGFFYFLGVVLIGCLLLAEHILIRDAKKTGSSRWLGVAFFNLNASVSVIYFIFSTIDFLVQLSQSL